MHRNSAFFRCKIPLLCSRLRLALCDQGHLFIYLPVCSYKDIDLFLRIRGFAVQFCDAEFPDAALYGAGFLVFEPLYAAQTSYRPAFGTASHCTRTL